MKKVTVCLLVCIIISLSLARCKTGKNGIRSKRSSKDSIVTLEIDGKSYPAHVITSKYEKEAKNRTKKSVAGASSKCVKWGNECEGDIFNGCILREIKLDYVDAEYEAFNTTKDLLASLTKGSAMLDGPLAQHRSRSSEESRNVIIKEAYMYMISKELDNDYHLILGDKPDYREANLFSAEISGLPESITYEDYKALKRVRDKFKREFSTPQNCNPTKKYTTDLTANPIKLTIKGSILFDNQHKHGGSGYKDVKTKTAWEIHPVLDFDLL